MKKNWEREGERSSLLKTTNSGQVKVSTRLRSGHARSRQGKARRGRWAQRDRGRSRVKGEEVQGFPRDPTRRGGFERAVGRKDAARTGQRCGQRRESSLERRRASEDLTEPKGRMVSREDGAGLPSSQRAVEGAARAAWVECGEREGAAEGARGSGAAVSRGNEWAAHQHGSGALPHARPHKELSEGLQRQALDCMRGAQGISTYMSACAKLGMRPSECFGKQIGAAASAFDAQGVANVLWACAVLDMQHPDEIFGKLCSRAGAVAQDFKPQNIANLMWACAKLEMRPPEELFGKLCSRAGDVMQDFVPHGISNLMWACATLKMRPPDLLSGLLCLRVWAVAQDFIPQGIANLMWAYAELKLRPPEELFDKLCSRAEVLVQDFDPQGISNMMWACASLDLRPPEQLFVKLCLRAGAVVQDFIAQHTANLMWACATLGILPPEELFGKLCARAGIVVQDFVPQGISNLMWACAALGMRPPDALFLKLCSRAVAVTQDFNLQNISNLIRACAKLGMRPPAKLFWRLCSRAGDLMQVFDPCEISSLMYACATLGMQPPDALFSKLCSRAGAVAQDHSPQDIASMMWACATLGMRPPDGLIAMLFSKAGDVVQDFIPPDISIVLWACAVFSLLEEGLGLLPRHPGRGSISFEGWSVQGLSQARQFLVTCNLEARDAQLSHEEMDLLREIQKANGALCLEAFTSEQAEPSRFQGQVVSAVGACGYLFEEEAVDNIFSGYSIDILVVDGAKVIAVEVDGPYHFLGGGRVPNGVTVLKRRHLEQLGYRAVSMPSWEWDSLSGAAEKEVYVRGLLDG